MVTPFQTSPANVLSAQPVSTGEKILVRSNNAADTMDVTLTGTVSGAPDSEVITLTGKEEKQSTKIFTALGSATLASASTGQVTLYGQGRAGIGDGRVNSVPADASTITLGLTGNTKTYTYRSPARITIQCVAVAALTQGDYFDVLYGATTKRFWYDIDTAGTGAPSDPGGGLFKISVITGDLAANVATKTNTSFATNLTQYATSVATDTVTITRVVLGTGSTADGTGGHDTAFTFTSVSAGTADAANQVRTVYNSDGTAMMETQVATNLTSAINASGGTAGTHYGTGTTAHTQFTATSSGATVTFTDAKAIGRQLAWSFTQSGFHHTLRVIAGASTGVALGTLRNAVTQLLAASIILDNDALTAATLPAGLAPTCDWIRTGGKRFSIQLQTAQTDSAIDFKYQTSNDKGVARDGGTTLTITTNSATPSDRDKLYTPPEAAEFVRLVVTSNPNALDTVVNAKLISG